MSSTRYLFKGSSYSSKDLKLKFKRELSSWSNMKTRCHNSKYDYWTKYGGKGITICDNWKISGIIGFYNFLLDMGERPIGTSLNRKDNNLGYNKENCEWSDLSNQCVNRGLFKNNKSGLAGVSWYKKNNTWMVYINKNGLRKYLGCNQKSF